jgi:hypothetical protein
MMNDIKVKTWKPIFTIPGYLVQELGDAGTYDISGAKRSALFAADNFVSEGQTQRVF